MQIIKKNIVISIMVISMVIVSFIISLNFSIDNTNSGVNDDKGMVTNYYKSEIIVNNDNSYNVNETINITFLSPRHGIYRYIPYLGRVNRLNKDGYFENIPYYENIKVNSSSEKIDSIDFKNGNRCIKFGDSKKTIDGNNEYTFNYTIVPKAQNGYTTIYYNIFPTYWQNTIPAGSEFSIDFPKEISKNIVNIYYGSYGKNYNASSILNLKWEENKLTGTLKQSLPPGSGLTLYAPVGDSYFSKNNIINNELYGYTIFISILGFISLILYFKFGGSEKITPVMQFKPPKKLDSAAAGYIIDGYIDNIDIISLFIYLADKGYIKFKKKGHKNDLSIIMVKTIDINEPQYIKVIFNGIFGINGKAGKRVELSDLKYKFQSNIDLSKDYLEDMYKHCIYTKSSKISRVVCSLFCILPICLFTIINCITTYSSVGTVILFAILELMYAIGVIILSTIIDSWYSQKKVYRGLYFICGTMMCLIGLTLYSYYYFIRTIDNIAFKWYVSLSIMLITTILMSICTIKMERRKAECNRLMEYLVGFKDFIENAEKDRIESLVEENPDLFYNVLPYAYVFGISTVWIKKFKNLTLKQPDWYEYADTELNLSSFNSIFMNDIATIKSTCISVPPSSNGSSSGGGSSGLGGGGGFSGGGFGGGGGGSW